MKKSIILAALILITKTTFAPSTLPTLRELAEEKSMWIGTAINADALQFDANYRALAGEEFNVITPENVFKFESLSYAQGRYFWRNADALVSWAAENDLRIRGHTLVWHNQQPRWLRDLTNEELEAALEAHIKTVVGRYKGQVQEWDVVNEAVDDNGSLRDTIWLRAIGPDYIAKAFYWAHEADPDAILYYNDYNGDSPGRKADAIYELVAGLVEDGVPIHGVGLQMHLNWKERRQATTGDIRQVMDRLGRLGLRASVTEMNVGIYNPQQPYEAMLELQAEMYAEVARACVEAPNCNTLVVWGLSDQYAWVPSWRVPEDSPLLFDEDFNPKPAYFALAQVLSTANAGEFTLALK